MNSTINNNLPILSNEGGLSTYLEQIKKFPMLDAEEEYMLAKNWRTNGNVKAAEKLVTSHLRLVAKIAMGYRGYERDSTIFFSTKSKSALFFKLIILFKIM